MDKRSLLAIVLSVFILVVYQGILSYLYPPTQKTVPTQPAEPITAAASSAPQSPQKKENQTELTSPSGVQGPALAAHEITVDNEVYTAIFTSLGGRLKSLRLKRYPGDAGRESPPLEMVKEGPAGELPLVFQFEGKDSTVSDEAVPYELQGQYPAPG